MTFNKIYTLEYKGKYDSVELDVLCYDIEYEQYRNKLIFGKLYKLYHSSNILYVDNGKFNHLYKGEALIFIGNVIKDKEHLSVCRDWYESYPEESRDFLYLERDIMFLLGTRIVVFYTLPEICWEII